MTQLFSNNVSGVLASGINNVATSLTLIDASGMPSPTGGDYFLLTFVGLNTNGVENSWEIMKCTARSGNVLTVVRGQEGTTAVSWATASSCQLRLTAGSMSSKADTAAKDVSGGYVGKTLEKINIWNTARTFLSFFTTAATAARTWTFPDKNGTVAMTSDITGTNSGTNTGDETTASIKSKLGITTLSGSNTGDQTLGSLGAEGTANKDASGGYAGLTLLKINFKNALNTFTSYFTNSNTASRTYTFPDKDGTVAMTSDITGTNSGTNTGDETTATIKSKLGITTLSGSNTGDQTLGSLGAEASANKDASGGYAGLTLFKLNMRNVANTFTSWFTNANTASRTYTLPDKDGTVAMTSDITGTNSGTNTGDETTASIKSKLGITTLSGSNTGDQTLGSLGGEAAANKDASGGYAGLTLLKINFKNVAGTFVSFLTNSNTAARTYTFPDKGGTVAMTSDITGTNSGTNTGDETVTSLGSKIAGATVKTTPVDADSFGMADSAASNVVKKFTWADLKTAVKTYLDTVHAALGANTFTGAQVYSDQQISRGMMKDMGVVFLDKGNSGTAAQTLDYTAGSHQKLTVTGAFTLSTSNWPPSGNLGELLLELVNGAAFSVTWPTINWIKSDGTTTTTFASNGITLQSSGTDWVLLWTRDGGTTIYGKVMR